MNPYAILGVRSSDSLDDIRKAYRKLAKKYHPDSPSGDVGKFQQVQEAWNYISANHSNMQQKSSVGTYRHTSLFNIEGGF